MVVDLRGCVSGLVRAANSVDCLCREVGEARFWVCAVVLRSVRLDNGSGLHPGADME